MLLSQKRQGVWDCHIGSSGLGSWCFVNYDLCTPWLHITLVESANSQGQALLTNDVVLVKQLLEQVAEGLKIRSFQAVFPSNFPDNKGWGIAEIDQMTESKTRKGEIFHTFHTRFGSHRIGGPERVKAIDVLPRDTVVLYENKRPIEPKLYYGR
tara:strand:- start:13870 stop:14331 length:462 start_codon:yes stop_codon:yes gene_type:complete